MRATKPKRVRRKKCRPHKLLENPELFALVRKLFLGCQWSLEQISNRLKLEGRTNISYKTIYRAIYAGMFDTPEQKRSTGNRGARRKLRYRGKLRRSKLVQANDRLGDWVLSSISAGTSGNVAENTNGLLREYFPKGYNFNNVSEEDLQAVVAQLNQRPRKCLSYKTPWEVYFSTMLRLA